MSNKIWQIFILFLLFSNSFTWSLVSHAVIAEQAAAQLSVSDRARLSAYADLLASGVDPQEMASLRLRYPGLSDWSVLVTLPDLYREMTVGAFFDFFGVDLPDRLGSYRDVVSGQWHYTTVLLGDRPSAQQILALSGVVEALQVLLAERDADPRQRAVVWLLVFHLLADLHQPLHVLSRLEGGVSDRGGNLTCWPSGAFQRQRCKHNLHALWDRGGFKRMTVKRLQAKLQGVMLDPLDPGNRRLLPMIQSAVMRAVLLGDRVYHLSGKRGAYYRFAQQTSVTRMALAAQRLAALFES